jgi:hypothetical protein
MPKQDGYNTNLAAEFHVLSVLHRLGFHASLTLGNRKAIDIVVETETRTLTIDVKGMASRTNWPLETSRARCGRTTTSRWFPSTTRFAIRRSCPPSFWCQLEMSRNSSTSTRRGHDAQFSSA